MAQANVIAKVSSLSGEAYARDSVGKLRRLKVGDVIREGETVVAENGAQVVLRLADGREMTVQPGETAKLDAEVGAAVKPDASDSAVATNPNGFQNIAQALTAGGDLDALLEDPAAGVAGPGGNEGHTFIEFLRVVESVDPLSYQFGTARVAPPESLQPAAPVATGVDAAVVPAAAAVGAGSALLPDSRTVVEDTVATGNVLANDSDTGGALSVAAFTVAGVAGSFTAGQTVTVAGVGTLSLAANGDYSFTPVADWNGTVPTITYTTNTGSTSTLDLTVTPVNDVPKPADPGNPGFDPATGNYSVTTPEDTPVSGQVVGTDADGDTLTYTKGSDPANGTVTVNPDGTWTYTPGPNYNGSDSFTVTIADGHGGIATSTVVIGVTPVDDASLLVADSQTIVEDTVATGNLLTNDSDVDSALTVAGFTVAGVAGSFTAGQTASIAGVGTLTIAANGDYTFTPAANWNGTVPTVSYTTNTGATSTLDITVSPLDDTPSISDDVATTAEDTPVVIRVLDNDSDADGDPLTITAIAGQPVVAGDTVAVANGTATLNADGTITFTPAGNYHGPAGFTYTATDGRTPVTADVNVTVTPVNDVPVALNDSATTAEDTPVTILVRANDSDADGDPLAVTGFTNPANGTVTLNAQGNLVYTPNTNFNGADTFSYTISDGQGGFASATVTVNVGGTNDAPLASPDTGSTTEDVALVVGSASGVIQNDSDLDGDSLAVSGVAFGAGVGAVGSALAGAWGSLTLQADGSYTYVPNAAAQALDDGESRTDVFTYTVSDPSGLSSTTTLSLTVTGVNDGPVAIDDARTTLQDTPVTIAVLGNDSDVDGEALTVTAIAGQPVVVGDTVALTNGTATLNADGTITFTPSAGYNGPADFSYTISDGTASDTANVHLVIDDVNDPPIAQDNVVNGSEDSPVNFDPRSNDSDPDGDPLTITEINGLPISPATPVTLPEGVVSQNADGTLTFTPNLNFNGPLSFQYTVADGRGGSDTATVNLNIAPVDDASVLVADSQSIVEDTVASGNVLINDSDVDNALTVASFTVAGVAGSFTAGQTATIAGIGTLTIAANGNYTFTPVANWNGTVPTANYTTNTGGTSTLDITVTPVDDAFTDANEVVSVAEDTTLTGSVLTGTSSVDGPVTVTGFTVAGVAGNFTAGQTATIAGVGALSIAANGGYTFTPAANYNGAVPVATYTLTDGSSGDTSTLSITVTAVDDAFTDGNEVVSVAEDTTLTGSVLTGTSSVDGPVTVTGFTVAGVAGSFTAGQTATIAGVGTLTIAANGGYTFTPAANYNGAVPVATYTLTDGSSGDTSTLSITVTPVNDNPLALDDSNSVPINTPTSGNVLANDSDLDGNPLTVSGFTVAGVAGSFTAGQTATIAGVGSLTIAANGDYTFTPAANYAGAIPVATYTISDGQGGGDSATLTLGMGNNAPPDALDDGPVAVTEDTPVSGNVLVNDSDPNGNPLTVSGFTVAGVAGSFTAGQTASIAGIGSLTIAANGDYTFTPAANYNGPVPVATYSISDGLGGTDSATLSLGPVVPVNDAFTDANEVVSVAEDTTLTGSVLTGTSSVDAPVTVTGFTVAGVAGSFTAGQTASLAGVGSLQINANGDYSFTPAANYNGSVPIATYTLTDGSSGDTSTLSITVTAVDDAFTDANEVVSIAEDTTLTGSVLTGTSSVDGPVTVTGFTVAGVAGSFTAGQTASIAGVGTLTIAANGDYTFIPAANYNGAVPVATYTLTDGSSGDTSTLSITVTAVDDAFADADEVVSVAEDTTLTGSVLTGTGSVDGPVTVTGFTVAGVAGSFMAGQTATIAGVGTLSIAANGDYSFTPAANYNGAVPVATYTLTDGSSGDTSTLSITVTAVDDAFTDANEVVSIAEDTTLTGSVLTGTTSVDGPVTVTGFTVAGVAGSFTAGQTATIAGVGTLTIAANGDYTFIPAANYNGAVPVATYTLTDGSSGDTSTLNITVTPVDDAFTDGNEVVSVAEDTTLTGSVLTGTTSVDGPVTVTGFTVAGVAGSFSAGQTATIAGVGTLTIAANGDYTFTPVANYNGPVPVATYTLTDGSSGDTSTLSITVTPVDDAFADANEVVSVVEDTTLTGSVLTGASSVDGPVTVTGFTVAGVAGSFTAGQTAAIAGIGTLQINANGNYTFTPVANWNGTVPTATYTLTDGSSGDISTLSITVTPVNDNPLALDDSNSVPINTPTSGNVLANDSDLDGNPLTVSSFTVAGVAGSFTAGQTATIAGVGTLSIAANGDYTFTPAANYAGAIPAATYTISDGQGGSDSATLTLGMGNNAPPNAVDDGPVGVTEDTLVSGNVLVNDSDPNNNPLTVTGFTVAGVAGSFTAGQTATIAGVGTLSIAANGDYTFTPVANYNGPVPVATYSISDGLGGTDSATLSLGPVVPVNDAPVLGDTPLMLMVAEDAGNPGLMGGSPISALVGGMSDADGGALQGIAVVGSNLTHGSWYFTTDGGTNWSLVGAVSPSSALLLANDANTRLYFMPDTNFNGTATAALTVRAWDQTSGLSGNKVSTISNGGSTAFSSATDTIDVQVTPVNDAPIAFGIANLAPIAEDTLNPPGATVATLFGGAGNFHDNTDQVAGGSSANAFAGIAISQYSAMPAIGAWQYSTDGGASWSVLGNVTPGAAITLQSSDLLRFVPAANYNGEATRPRANLIESGVAITSGATVDLVGATGGTSHYSQSTVELRETVTPVDDPSVLVADSKTVAEDTVATGNVLTNDSDVDNALTVASFTVTGVAGSFAAGQTASIAGVGNLTIAANGNYTFTPVANWNGTVPTVNYTTNTGSTSTLDITVAPVDDAFTDANEVVSVAEDTTLTGSALTGTSSVDGPVTVTGFTVAGVAGSFTAGQTATIAGVGTLSIAANGDYSFTPVANYNGAVPVATYTLTDGSSGDTSTLSITVTAVDDVFTDGNEVVSVAEDTTLTGSVLTGTTSVDGPVTVTGFTVAGVAGSFTAGQTASIAGIGTLTISANGNYTFTPVANWNGTVPTATYTLTDGSSGDTSTLNITVTPVDDAFADANEVVSVAEDTTLTGSVLTGTTSVDGPVTVTGFTVAGVAGSFTAGQTASIAGIGTLSIAANGDYTFIPAANYNGAVPVATYTLTDGSSGDTSTLSITVTAVDDAFTDGNEVVSVAEDTTLTGSVLTGTSSVDGPVTVTGFTVAGVAGSFTAGQTATIAGVGTLSIAANGDYTFIPAANYNGSVPVATYTLTDGSSGDTSTLSITVTAVDDAFTDANEVVSVAEDTTLTGSVLSGTSSVDGPVTVTGFTVAGVAGSFTAGQTAAIAGIGTLTIAANGDYTFTPVANYNGSVPVATYTLTDGSSGDTSTLSITVTPVDDAFADANEVVSVAEDTTLTGSVLSGTTSVDGPVTVTGFTVAGVAGNFTAGQTATIAGVGTLTIAANGDYTFTPLANYNGSVPVATYTLTDGSSGDTSTLSITVTPVDDAFTDANEVVSVAEDTTLTGSVLTGTSSVDGPVTVTGFTVAGVAGSFTAGQTATIAGVGSLQINTNGDYTFTPVANYNGSVPVATYTLTDGSSGDTSTLSITVTAVDDAFADANEVVSVAEDTTLTGSVLTGTSSVDGPVTVTGFSVAGVAGSFTAGQTATIAGVGTLSIAANGDYSFTPVANYNGAVPVATYTLTDGSSGDTSTLAITVTPVNDAPTVGSAAISVSEEGLAGGLADTLGSPGDTTNLAVRSGTIGIADVDSSATVSLQAPVTALTAGGVAVTWSGAGTQTLIGSAGSAEVIRVTIDNGGNYQVSLSKALDHSIAGSEDTLSFNVGVTATDGTNSASGAIALTIEDDSSLASSSVVTVGGTATNTNLAIVLDLSGSMDFASGLNNTTRLAVTKEAIKELIDTYDGMGDVMVNVTVFGSSGTNGTWMTAANALQFINTVQAFSTDSTMYTNYDAALASAMSAYGGAGKLAGSNVQNVLYFLSDGAPNLSDGNSSQLLNSTPTNSASDNGIQGTEETIWTNFLSNNSISAYAIGLGTGVTTANMDPVAYDGVTGTPRDSVAVEDLNDLSSVLASTIESRVTGAIMIDGSGSGGFGADGGYLAALTYGNNTFSFNGSVLTVSGAGTTAYSFDAATHMLTVTAVGGPFVVDMDTGEYIYTRTPSSSILQETFGYTLTDKDSDISSGTLIINLPDYDTAPIARDDRVTVASGSVSSNTVTIKDAWLTWNDSDAESTTLTVSAVSNASSHTGNQVVDAVSASSGGSGSFSYTVSDGGQTNGAAVSITTVNNSTLNGTGLDNILIGDTSNETIRGYEGNDVLVGNAGADTLDGGSGNDLLIGGTGNDSLTGGIGSDTFAWSLADQGTAATPARDTITDFSTAAKAAGGDVLDLRDLLQGENHASGTGNLTDYLHFTKSGSDTVIDIKPTGASGSVTQQIVMSGVDLTVNNTLNDQAIIQDLLTKGKLVTD